MSLRYFTRRIYVIDALNDGLINIESTFIDFFLAVDYNIFVKYRKAGEVYEYNNCFKNRE